MKNINTFLQQINENLNKERNSQLKERLLSSIGEIIKLFMSGLWDSSIIISNSNIYLSSSYCSVLDVYGLLDSDEPNYSVLLYVFKYEKLVELMTEITQKLGYQKTSLKTILNNIIKY